MASSRQKARLFDPLRQMWVAATPEECVRQRLLRAMIDHLGFPKHLLAVEKQLSELPHLAGKTTVPLRRVDLLCYSGGTRGLTPLLLIECKEVAPDEQALRQALGYNYYVQAPFVAVAGAVRVELIYPQSLPYLPTFAQLQEAACR